MYITLKLSNNAIIKESYIFRKKVIGMAGILRILLFIMMIPAFGSSFFILSLTGSYLTLEPNWQEKVVFTPTETANPEQIYFVDKLIYAFPFHPWVGIACFLSFATIIGLLIYWIMKKVRF
jgi:hypothetical protein